MATTNDLRLTPLAFCSCQAWTEGKSAPLMYRHMFGLWHGLVLISIDHFSSLLKKTTAASASAVLILCLQLDLFILFII